MAPAEGSGRCVSCRRRRDWPGCVSPWLPQKDSTLGSQQSTAAAISKSCLHPVHTSPWPHTLGRPGRWKFWTAGGVPRQLSGGWQAAAPWIPRCTHATKTQDRTRPTRTNCSAHQRLRPCSCQRFVDAGGWLFALWARRLTSIGAVHDRRHQRRGDQPGGSQELVSRPPTTRRALVVVALPVEAPPAAPVWTRRRHSNKPAV